MSALKGVPVTWGTLILATFGAGGAVAYYNYEWQRRKTADLSKRNRTYGKPDLGGPWTLVDEDGVPYTSASFHGKYCLIYFGFTRCPDICPTELVKVGQVLDGMPASVTNQIAPLFISVDPHRDTVGQLREYGQDFHPSIKWLVGTPDQVASVAKAFRVYHSKADQVGEDDYLVDHSIVVYLVGKDGAFLDFCTQSMAIADVKQKIIKHIADGNAAADGSSGSNGSDASDNGGDLFGGLVAKVQNAIFGEDSNSQEKENESASTSTSTSSSSSVSESSGGGSGSGGEAKK